MPGLIEAHIHLTYFNVTELQDLDIKFPVEYVTLQSAVNAKTALECGYTSGTQRRLPAQHRCVDEKGHRGGHDPRSATQPVVARSAARAV